MIFFRQKLEEVITLPPPPKDDMAEALEVQDIVNARTPEEISAVLSLSADSIINFSYIDLFTDILLKYYFM